MQALLSRLQKEQEIPGRFVPVTYIVFDILEKDKKPLTALPFSERREVLKKSVTEGPHVILSVPVDGRGEDYYHAAVAKGLEGVVAKRKDSPYEPGQRSGAWLKVKGQKTCDCVIAGYTLGKGGRSSTFGARLTMKQQRDDTRGTQIRFPGFPPAEGSPCSTSAKSGRVFVTAKRCKSFLHCTSIPDAGTNAMNGGLKQSSW
jgi:ATP-dependent DNA ligase